MTRDFLLRLFGAYRPIEIRLDDLIAGVLRPGDTLVLSISERDAKCFGSDRIRSALRDDFKQLCPDCKLLLVSDGQRAVVLPTSKGEAAQ